MPDPLPERLSEEEMDHCVSSGSSTTGGVPDDPVERIAACICWGEFAGPRADTPYEYWATVKNRAPYIAAAVDALGQHGSLWRTTQALADTIARSPYPGYLRDLRKLASRVPMPMPRSTERHPDIAPTPKGGER